MLTLYRVRRGDEYVKRVEQGRVQCSRWSNDALLISQSAAQELATRVQGCVEEVECVPVPRGMTAWLQGYLHATMPADTPQAPTPAFNSMYNVAKYLYHQLEGGNDNS